MQNLVEVEDGLGSKIQFLKLYEYTIEKSVKDKWFLLPTLYI